MTRPFVSICVPSRGVWSAATGVAIAQLCCVSMMECDLAIPNGQHGSSAANGRNRLVLSAQQNKADWIMWIDSDMVFPPDSLLRLLAHNKEMVGATYNRRSAPYDTMGKWETVDFSKPGSVGLVKAFLIPTGLLLMKISVFEKIDPPWFYETHEWDQRSDNNIAGVKTEDIVFSERAIAAGITPFIDFDLTFEVGHVGEQIIGCQRPKQRD
jgi:hypothetical protein